MLEGAQAGHGWQRNIPSVCGHAVSQLCDTQSQGGEYYFQNFSLLNIQLTQYLTSLFSVLWCCEFVLRQTQWEVNTFSLVPIVHI